MKIDLDELERTARTWSTEDAEWYPGVGPAVTLALIARIRELEIGLRRSIEFIESLSRSGRPLPDPWRVLLEKGAVLP